PTVDTSALTQQLLEAQRNLIGAQNQLVNIWVQYLTTRMQLYRDLELLPLDPRGAWIDDVATCHCPDGASPGRNDPRPDEDAPPRRAREPPPAPAREGGPGGDVPVRRGGLLKVLAPPRPKPPRPHPARGQARDAHPDHRRARRAPVGQQPRRLQHRQP